MSRAGDCEVDSVRRRVGCGLLASLGLPVWADPPMPASPPARALRIAAPFERTLDNGLRLIVVERHAAPLVSARLLVLSGSETDPPRRAGRAALTTALLGRGTRRYSAPSLAAAAEALGGSLLTECVRHQSSVGLTVTSPMLDAALGLVAEVVMRPSFHLAELIRLRSQMQDELKLTHATPAPLAAMTVERLLFGDSPYGRAVDGTPTSLPRISRRQLVGMHAAHFRADNAALLLAGDVDPQTALTLAERHFGHWKAAPASTASTEDGGAAAGGHRLDGASAAAVDFGSSTQAAVALGIRLPARAALGEADAAALQVANAVLGAGYSSRLNQEIRIRRGLSYGASSSIRLAPDAGLLLASVQTRNESAVEAVELMQRQVDRLLDAPVPEDELAARKASLIGSFARRIETTEGLAGLVATRLANGAPTASLVGHPARIAAVDAGAVLRQARLHFGRSQRCIAVAGDARQFAKGLQDAEPRLVRLRIDELDFD